MGAQVTLSRRGLLGGFVALGLADLAGGAEITVVSDDLPLAVGSRATRLFRIRTERGRPRGVALFSAGHGSWPEKYQRLTSLLAMDGWVVLAPLHVDSVRHPDRATFTMQASFGERIADMGAAAAYAARTYPKLPVVAVGHSFGTLTSLCLGGALDDIGKFRNPAVGAVLGFSTPGRIPGLIQPVAYRSVAVPLMLVTGDVDRVPGFVTDPADHLFPADTAPTPTYAWIGGQGGHDLVGEDALLRAWPAAKLFLAGRGLGDERAVARLDAWTAAAGDRFVVRKGKA